jgi:hypothetical protein
MKICFMFNSVFFFCENRIVCVGMWQNVAVTEGPQMTSQHGAYALRAGLAKLHTLMRMHTPTGPDTQIHALTHAHADQ